MKQRVVHISTSDKGGAGIAAVRLHKAMLLVGIDSHLLTMVEHSSTIPNHAVAATGISGIVPFFAPFHFFFKKLKRKLGMQVNAYSAYHDAQLKGRPAGYEYFSFPVSGYQLQLHPLVKKADIIHLHWVSEGFLNVKSFFNELNKPLVWTLHDMNPFTGGCHHADGCEGFQLACFPCPQLKGTVNERNAEGTLNLKYNAVKKLRLSKTAVVAPSQWMLDLARKSKVLGRFDQWRIPNMMETEQFIPMDKVESRKKRNLPLDKKLIFFVAHHIQNPRKGIHFLIDAINLLNREDVLLCSVGYVSQELRSNTSVLQLGYVSDPVVMAELLSAGDVFVLPSLAENFPNTTVESLLCGTPVVAFNVGGISEQIDKTNGYLVNEISALALADKLKLFFENQEQFDSAAISRDAHMTYNSSQLLTAYLAIYQQLSNG